MQTSLPERDAKFHVEDDCLVRVVTAADGRGYSHRCDLATFETVAYAVEETPAEGEGTTLTKLVKAEKLPFTRVNVALEFLKERGIVEVRHRRCYPATKSVHLDAMTETPTSRCLMIGLWLGFVVASKRSEHAGSRAAPTAARGQ